MPPLPTGTVTFFFTDIEGSTARWEQFHDLMKDALPRHNWILRAAIEENGGSVFKTVGDAFCAAFAVATDALAAAIQAQRLLEAEEWGGPGPIRVRIGLHTGTVEEQEGDYFGPPVNRVARLMSAGYGGQILLSAVTRELVSDALPDEVTLRDMGAHRLKDLSRPERIYQVMAPDLRVEFPSLKTLHSRPNNLPPQSTPFVGREREVAETRSLITKDSVRLLTLIGPGGTGKTRLSLQVAADLLDDFPDGVFFVPLDQVTDPDLVPSAIAQALGVYETGGQTLLDRLKSYLRDKKLLLVLDNFEQIVDAGSITAELFSTAPQLKGIVSSREALRVSGEYEYPVPPLSLPDPRQFISIERLSQYESVQLFIERAQSVKPDFAITNENAPAVAGICQQLDGLPLAIELAAARIRLLPPPAILSRLESRLQLLTSGAKNLPKRQQTLRGAIAWSYDLLDESEKTLFHRLSIFSGGCSLEAAEALCGDDPATGVSGLPQEEVLDSLEALAGKSLVRQKETDGGEPRFHMLQTLREYALEKLSESGEREAMLRRHARYYMQTAEEQAKKIRAHEEFAALQALSVEIDNLRTAWHVLRNSEDHAEMADFSLALYFPLYHLGFWTELRQYLREGLQVAENLDEPAPRQVAALKLRLASLAHDRGELEEAHSLAEQSLALYFGLSELSGVAEAFNLLGLIAMDEDRLPEAKKLFEDSLRLRAEADAYGRAVALHNLAQLSVRSGQTAEARTLYESALEERRRAGDRRGEAETLGDLGSLAFVEGKPLEAKRLYKESLSLRYALQERKGIGPMLFNLGEIAELEGDDPQAVRLYLQAHRIFRELQSVHAALSEKALQQLEGRMGESEFTAAKSSDRELDWEETQL